MYRRRISPLLLLPAVLFMLPACNAAQADTDSDGNTQAVGIDCPAEISARAFRFAELYRDSETEYAWGGQDPVRAAIKTDCSGLVIMCYKYALVDTGYRLLFDDTTAHAMYTQYSARVPLARARRGDLIFMGEADVSTVTHIALFDREKNGTVYFIDSTKKRH